MRFRIFVTLALYLAAAGAWAQLRVTPRDIQNVTSPRWTFNSGVNIGTGQYNANGFSVAGGLGALTFDDANGYWTLAGADGLHALNLQSPLWTVTGTGGQGTVTYSNGWVFSPALPYASSTHNHTGTYQPLDGDLTTIAGLVPSAAGMILKWDGAAWSVGDDNVGSTPVWGSITGTLSHQTDLQNALDAKQPTLTAGTGISLASNTVTNTDTGSAARAAHEGAYTHGDIALNTAARHTRGHTVASTSDHTDWPAGLTVTELGYVDGVTSGIQAQLNTRAPLASPTFTGDPKAPTPATGDNDTSLATTAYVKGQGYITASGTAAGFSGTLQGDVTGTQNSTTVSKIGGQNLVGTPSSDGMILKTSGSTLVWSTDNDTVYTHPTGDGNLHVPATGTTNNGKVLTAGATAGSLSWTAIPATHDAVTLGTNPGLTLTGQQIAVIFGTSAYQAAHGNHNHAGVYQGASAALSQLAGLSPSASGQVIKWDQTAGSWVLGTDNNTTYDLSPYLLSATAASTYISLSQRGAANGVATLDASTKIPIAQVPTGTTSSTVSLGNHAHTGTYEPANANIQAHISSASNPHGVTASQLTAGTLADARLSNNVPLKNTLNTFVDGQTIASGNDTLQLGHNGLTFYNDAQVVDSSMVWDPVSGYTFEGNITGGTFTGSGAGLTSLNATQLTTGTLPDARLSSNVAMRNASNTFSGGLTATAFNIDRPAGLTRDMVYFSGGSPRWVLRVSEVAESGANEGSDFYFMRRNDAGGIINVPLFIKRSTGNVGMGGQTAPSEALHVNGNIKASGVLYGSGAGLTADTIPIAALDTSSGTPSSSTYLRGDGTWSTPATGGLTAGGTLSGSIASANLYNFSPTAFPATANTRSVILAGNDMTDNNQTGVWGVTYSGRGISGEATASAGVGVYGKHLGSGTGVDGEASSGYGVRGTTSSGSAGVYGISYSGYGPALRGYQSGNYAGLLINQTHSTADIARFQKSGSDVLTITNVGELKASGTGSWRVPVGTTSQRPASPQAGDIRFNSTTSKFEGYTGSAWVDFH